MLQIRKEYFNEKEIKTFIKVLIATKKQRGLLFSVLLWFGKQNMYKQYNKKYKKFKTIVKTKHMHK